MLPQGKTKCDDIEIKKLEMLNSILIKELRGYKLKIIELQDENENLQAENSKLKNSFECCGRIENLEIEHIKDDQVNDQDQEKATWFMNVTKITNVYLVANHFLKQEL